MKSYFINYNNAYLFDCNLSIVIKILINVKFYIKILNNLLNIKLAFKTSFV